MSKLTKNQKAVMAKYDHTKVYTLSEACALLKDITYTKFDSSVEISANLGVDPRKANQMIRGVVTLPHGTGKITRVLALCTPDKEAEAQAAGADYVGLDEYIDKIKGGWTDIDVIVCTPSVMAKVGALGRILGPRGLMPNPKTGTVTMEIGNAIKEVKAGKIDFKVDKTGIVHAAIGKISFTTEQIYENAAEFLNAVAKLKPQSLKGTYMKSAAVCTTMSPGVKVDIKAFLNGAEK
ncbi:MAG: 50S ribosomal protein L1 [Candidatus Methanomethylophilaceae archaeon]|jgi:large subunit ribosomal protein L1|nr:50S ribosomal protein L1 [Candidatus Methanomethylophilaceae archaeon]